METKGEKKKKKSRSIVKSKTMIPFGLILISLLSFDFNLDVLGNFD